MRFQGKEHMRTKIVMNGKIIEQVRDLPRVQYILPGEKGSQ